MVRTNARTRVMLLIDHLNSGGGAQCILRDIVTIGDREHLEFGVAYWFDRSAYTDALRSVGVEEHCLGQPGSKWLTWLNVLLPYRLLRLVRRVRPRILHVHASTLPLLHGVLCRLVVPGLTLIYTQHLSRCQCSRFWQWWQSLWMRRYDVVATDLEQSCAEARDYGVPEDRIQCIPFGVRWWSASEAAVERVVHEIGARAGEPILLSVARLAKDRRIDVFIRALPAILLQHPRCKLVLVGDGKEAGPLRQLVRDLGVEDRVLFTGQTRDPMPFYRACDVYLTMTIGGELGVAGWQAALSGKPVIAIVSDYPQGADNADTPFLSALSVEEFANRVITLLSDPAARRRLTEAGEKVAREKHSPEAMVERYMRLYAEAIDGQRD